MLQQARLRRAVVLAALTASLPLSAHGPAQTPVQAPGGIDPASLFAEIKRRMPLDADLQSGYVCIQRETEVRLDGDGHPTSRTTREYEVYPAVAGNPPVKRLIARDGVPLTPAELAENDRRQAETVKAEDRDKRLNHEADDRRERKALVDEIFRLFDFRITGQEVLNGRPSYLVAFTPRPGLSASNRIASIAQKFAGRAWIDEQDLQVVRVEAKSTDDVTYGLGMFARIYKGTSVFWERRKVDETAWVPARLEIRAAARVLLFRRLGLYRVTDYSDYHKVKPATGSGR